MRRAAADRVFASRCARYERWMRRMCRRSALAISITSPRMVNFVSSTRRACQRRTVHWITIAPRASFDLRIASSIDSKVFFRVDLLYCAYLFFLTRLRCSLEFVIGPHFILVFVRRSCQ